MKYFVFSLLSLTMLSCTTLNTVIEAQRGDECLRNNDYDGALEHYLKAERELPGAVTYGRLACFYLFQGDFEKAWPYLHRATYINPDNAVIMSNFVSVYVSYLIPKYKLDSWNQSSAEIIGHLGEPDDLIKGESTTCYLIYGVVALKFQNDLLCDHFWFVDPQILPNSPPEVIAAKNKLAVFKAE